MTAVDQHSVQPLQAPDDADLAWLPSHPDWPPALAAARRLPQAAERVRAAAGLAGYRHNFLVAGRIDRIASLEALPPAELQGLGLTPVRLAILSSHTVDHLVPALRVAGLGRRLALDLRVAPYGQYRQVLLGPETELDAFSPQVVLLALDEAELQLGLPLEAAEADVEEAVARRIDEMRHLWRRARERYGATVVQQTVVNTAPALFGNYDGLVAASPAALVERLNAGLRRAAREEGVLLLDLAWQVARDGQQRWLDPVRWHQAKQLVSLRSAPLYGDLLARVAAAVVGLSRKCLVLDLDNTVWGGVIGDDGLGGIVLGQGSAAGEAYAGFQRYCGLLGARGVILAVCSKNDEANAFEAFDKHPEMVLRRDQIAAFVANWRDKAANLRDIAAVLNIGLDSLVFVDDNPAERAIVRQELPMVAVPELPEDVAGYAARLAEAGYFEAAAFTADDAQRGRQYALNAERQRASQTSATDMDGFLRGLEMVMDAGPIAPVDLARVTQLTNKTNQFNLTTRRYTEAEIGQVMEDPASVTLRVRLADRFGDNGLIAVVMARPAGNAPAGELAIDTWLMSCRVLGRGVERAMLQSLVRAASARGATALIGVYKPTAKNGMVSDHYAKLGFEPMAAPAGAGEGTTFWKLELARYVEPEHFILIREGVA